ncbi:MAG: DUF1064 domain-containing protein [Muribaculaceae bacterium]
MRIAEFRRLAAAAQKPKSKYNAKPTQGYASRKEYRRAAALKLLEKSGQITRLQEQVVFELIPAQYVGGKLIERPVTYVADFVYHQDGNLVVEDCKGLRTPVYTIKRKLMLQRYGIIIYES